MTIKIEFAGDQPEKREVKTYTGSVKDWPDGLYAAKGCYIIVGTLGRVLITDDGKAWHIDDAVEAYTRISDDPRIAAITFAGTMNYPDGKPDGVDEPDPIEAACEEIRRVCDEQFAKSQLSDPTDLKVGDWVYGEYSEKCHSVCEVWGSGFKTSDGGIWPMNGVGYTVVPAPKDHQ